jgi:hypothetical protein
MKLLQTQAALDYSFATCHCAGKHIHVLFWVPETNPIPQVSKPLESADMFWAPKTNPVPRSRSSLETPNIFLNTTGDLVAQVYSIHNNRGQHITNGFHNIKKQSAQGL